MHGRRRDAGCIFVLASTAKVRSALFDIVGVFDMDMRVHSYVTVRLWVVSFNNAKMVPDRHMVINGDVRYSGVGHGLHSSMD